MGQLTYRSTIYRGAYGVIFVAAYLLITAYLLSGDDSGSESSAGVWRLVLGMVLVCAVGAAAGPTLHRRLFKTRVSYRRVRKPGKHLHK